MVNSKWAKIGAVAAAIIIPGTTLIFVAYGIKKAIDWHKNKKAIAAGSNTPSVDKT